MIALDAMGGDFAPDAILKGAVTCAKQAGIAVCLFGPREELERRLEEIDSSWRSYPLTIADSPEVIGMGDEPVAAVRQKQSSSLVRSIASLADAQKESCRVAVSAGNSGAMLAAALFLLGRNEGVLRPALAGLLPGKNGTTVLLDLGANADCKPEYLYQFAHLGAQYAKDMLGVEDPKIGLLSNGEEPTKGSALTKEAFALLQKSSLRFEGNVEPQHILANAVDVVVTDGFAGNVLLKTFEATVRLCGQGCACKPPAGGALLIGVKKPVIVVHGCADAAAIEQALLFAQEISEKVDVEKYCVPKE